MVDGFEDAELRELLFASERVVCEREVDLQGLSWTAFKFLPLLGRRRDQVPMVLDEIPPDGARSKFEVSRQTILPWLRFEDPGEDVAVASSFDECLP